MGPEGADGSGGSGFVTYLTSLFFLGLRPKIVEGEVCSQLGGVVFVARLKGLSHMNRTKENASKDFMLAV